MSPIATNNSPATAATQRAPEEQGAPEDGTTANATGEQGDATESGGSQGDANGKSQASGSVNTGGSPGGIKTWENLVDEAGFQPDSISLALSKKHTSTPWSSFP